MLTLLHGWLLAEPSSSNDVVSCAILEGRANVLDRRSSTSNASSSSSSAASCSSLPAGAPCSAYFETLDSQRSLFRPCKPITGERCKAAGGAPLPCGIAAQLPRLRELRRSLAREIAALRARSGVGVGVLSTAAPSAQQHQQLAREAAVVALGETFELAIARDAEAPAAVYEAAYAVLLRRASPHGWADGPHGAAELGAQLPLDEAAGLEVVLRAALRRVRSLANHSSFSSPSSSSSAVVAASSSSSSSSVAPVGAAASTGDEEATLLGTILERGYFRRASGGAPVLGGGFNAVGKILGFHDTSGGDGDGGSVGADGGGRGGTAEADEATEAATQAGAASEPAEAAEWAPRLRALGANVIALNVYLHLLQVLTPPSHTTTTTTTMHARASARP